MFEYLLHPNQQTQLFGKCTHVDIINETPLLFGYNLIKTQVESTLQIDSLTLYYQSILHKQISKEYIRQRCYQNVISKL